MASMSICLAILQLSLTLIAPVQCLSYLANIEVELFFPRNETYNNMSVFPSSSRSRTPTAQAHWLGPRLAIHIGRRRQRREVSRLLYWPAARRQPDVQRLQISR
ncbi:hypothetical protein BDV10DRAFT_157658 [Aspergillus recurvatus]